jgi:hypothetical protein
VVRTECFNTIQVYHSQQIIYTHVLNVRFVGFLNVKLCVTSRNNCNFNGGVSYTLYCILRFRKKNVDISRLAEWFIASEEALCPMQLFFTEAFASLKRA